jgi:hypothetical protein
MRVLGRMFRWRASWRTVEILGDESNNNSKNRQQSFEIPGRSRPIWYSADR